MTVEVVVILDKSSNLLFSFYKISYNEIGDNMKVLTIKQPWASLIVNKYKTYEFRSWKTNYRGKILIHAGLTMEKDISNKLNYNIEYIQGAIIGEAIITDCILVDEAFNNELNNINKIVYGNTNKIGKYAWKLENIVKYDKPVFIKGKLGLWNYNEK